MLTHLHIFSHQTPMLFSAILYGTWQKQQNRHGTTWTLTLPAEKIHHISLLRKKVHLFKNKGPDRAKLEEEEASRASCHGAQVSKVPFTLQAHGPFLAQDMSVQIAFRMLKATLHASQGNINDLDLQQPPDLCPIFTGHWVSSMFLDMSSKTAVLSRQLCAVRSTTLVSTLVSLAMRMTLWWRAWPLWVWPQEMASYWRVKTRDEWVNSNLAYRKLTFRTAVDVTVLSKDSFRNTVTALGTLTFLIH